jgi:tRNA threonylcarbamoyl adenosine modification protein (Sua5/YciO/YrdC/YwlC family)
MATAVSCVGREGAPPVSGHLGRSSIRRVAAVLASGGVAILPTDTIYGFHCAVSNARGIETILKLKGSAARAGLILLASDVAMARALVARWPGRSARTLGRVWPAPLTAILPARGNLPPRLSSSGTVAVRVPAHAELRAVIRALGEPIVSTSVNRSGDAPLTRIADIRRAFPGLGGYLSRGGRSPALPSTIVDFTGETATLVRAGRHPWPADD